MIMPMPFYIKSVPAVFTGFPTDWKFPSANALRTANQHAWTNPGNAYADDGSNVTTGSVSWASSDAADIHDWTGFGFTTSDVPIGATILGVEFEIEFACDNDFLLRPKGLKPSGPSAGIAGTTVISAATGVVTYGGASSLAGFNSLTDTEVRSSNFGLSTTIAAEFMDSNPTTAELAFNYIKCRIHGEI